MAEQISEQQLDAGLKSFNEYMKDINGQLEELNQTENKEYYQSQRPSSIIGRVFDDIFGVVGLYLMLFILCDFSRVIVQGGDFFGMKYLFWGPYYYLTSAPLMTRIWESKKFLKDLGEVERGDGFTWPDERPCSTIGSDYTTECGKGVTRNHPIKDKVGDGLDWLIRHTIGKSFGGILGNGNCTDQGTTIANDCALDRCTAIWNAYNAFCDQNDNLIKHRATDINWPNTVASSAGDFNGWNSYDLDAYHMYYNSYLGIYDIGSTVFGGHGTPENLNPVLDTTNYYSLNAPMLFGLIPTYNGTGVYFPVPDWFRDEAYIPWVHGEMSLVDFIRYFQLHYKEHTLDYWDTT